MPEKMSVRQQFVYRIFCDLAETHQKYPSVDELSSVSGLSKMAVIEHLQRLKKKGWIVHKRRGIYELAGGQRCPCCSQVIKGESGDE